MIEHEPDEEEKKNLILYLLNNGLNAYKRYIRPISNFNNNEIENLFQGEKDFAYSGINSKQIFFQRLLDKFNNFSFLLEYWYNDPAKRSYINELWQKNPCLDELKSLNHEEIKQKLPFINNWPEEIRNDFFDIINEYIGRTRVYLMKDKLIKDEEDIKIIINLLKETKEFLEKYELSEECKENLRKSYEGIEEIVFDFLKNNTIEPIKEGINEAIEEVERMKREAKNNFFSFLFAPEEKEESIINLEKIKEISKMFIKTKSSGIIYLIISFANFGYSCNTFCQTLQKLKEIKDYKDRLSKIKQSFEAHCNIEIENDSIDSAKEKIKKAKLGIEEDYKELLVLICEIENAIDELKTQQQRSVASLVSSSFSAIFGFIRCYLNGSIPSFSYLGISLNVASGMTSAADLLNTKSGISNLKKILEEANKQREKMKEKLNDLENNAINLKEFIEESRVNY